MADETPGQKIDDSQLAGLIVSATVIIGFLVYWAVQIQDVRELLALAYG